jgi:Ca-activated chloride channel family protein
VARTLHDVTVPTSLDAPERLLLLLVVAALAVAYAAVQVRRRTGRRAWASDALLPSTAPRRPGALRHVAAGLLALSLVAMTVAFAQPRAEQEVVRERATVVVTLDASTSMWAQDVAPSRFAAAVAAATAFVQDLPDGFDVGLVTFAGTATLQVPPTRDHEQVLRAIASLELDGGTALGDAVHTSLDALAAEPGGEPEGAVVLLADGGSTAGSSVDGAVQRAVDAGVPVHTIAYGTPEGVVVTAEGRSIPVPVDEQVLEDIATATGGRAETARTAGELAAVYGEVRSRLTTAVERVDVSAGVVGLALVLLAAGAVPVLLRR